MSPSWNRVADEINSLARDRALAASRDPSGTEASLLERESILLAAAGEFAATGLEDDQLCALARAGLIVDGDGLLVWGITADAERSLRALAADRTVDMRRVDPRTVLAIVLGRPVARG